MTAGTMSQRLRHEGYVTGAGGVRIHYESTGAAAPVILLLPTWTVLPKRFWKCQVPYLSRHFALVTYDGPGNGRSDRPVEPAAYDATTQVDHALAVLDACGIDRAVVVALSKAANWALDLAANHADRVLGTVLVGPSLPLSPVTRNEHASGWEGLARSGTPALRTDPPEHWGKYDPDYWEHDYEDFLWFFFGRALTEPHSTKQVEDAVGWGMQTTPEILAAEAGAAYPGAAELREWCARIRSPLLAIHGSDDQVSPPVRSEMVADLAGADLVLLGGAGHFPLARDPVKVNLLIREFAEGFR